MSFSPGNLNFNTRQTSFGRARNEAAMPFWQQVVLVTLPAFVGSCVPHIIDHFLNPKPAATPETSEKPAPDAK